MHNLILKVVSIFSVFGANGVGNSVGGGTNTAEAGSAIASIIAKIAEFLGQVVTIIYGWIMSILWYVVRLVLNIIDVLQYFVEKLVGIDIYKEQGWSKLTSIEDSDLIIKLLFNKTVLKVFLAILILSAILLIIFTILSLIKSNYEAATNDGDIKTKPGDIFKRIGKSLFLILIIPTMIIVGVLGSNVVLASICNAISGNNNLTLGGIIFNASSYNANKYRIYANTGLRMPIVAKDASEIIVPTEYQDEEDMQVLFYKLANGDVYIGYVCDNEDTSPQNLGWFKDMQQKTADQGGFDRWLNEMDLSSARKTSASGQYMAEFVNDFQIFYKKYCDSEPLSRHSGSSPLLKSIYETNWTINSSKYRSCYNFSTTYEIAKANVYFAPTGATVDIYQNSNIYQDYESFATIELEYYVMADMIDYAIKHGEQLYYVNANNPHIMWSNIPINNGKETVDITSYNNEFNILYNESDGQYYTYYGKITEDNTKGVYSVSNGIETKYYLNSSEIGADPEVTLLSNDSFYVSYYNGVNRLYWSQIDAVDEESGATFIICTKTNDGTFIPVTQKTTSFHSSFLNENYDGPIVARGLFTDETSIQSGSSLHPTAIREQKVDEYGNELSESSVSAYSLSDDGELQNAYSGLGQFVGNVSKLMKASNNFMYETYGTLLGIANDIAQNQFGNLMESMMSGVYIKDSNGTTQRLDNLYINGNIAYYALSSDNKTIYFYDSEYKQMGYKVDKDTYNYAIEVNGVTDVNTYYIYNRETGINCLISYDDLQANSIAELLTKLMGSEEKNANKMTYEDSLIIRYTGKLVNFKRDGNNQENILVGMKATGLSQRGSDFVTSGQFEMYDYVATITSPFQFLTSTDVSVYSSRIENLSIKDGEVYTANGTKIVGYADAKKLFATSLDRALSLLTSPFGENTIKYLSAMLIVASENNDAITLTDEIKAEARNFVSNLGNLTGAFTEIVNSFVAEQSAFNSLVALSDFANELKTNHSNLLFKILGAIVGSDIVIGVGSVRELDKTYYSISADEQDELKGTITYYNSVYSSNGGNSIDEYNYTLQDKDSVQVTQDGSLTLNVVMNKSNLTKVAFVSVGALDGFYAGNNEASIYKYNLNYKLHYSKYGDKYLGAYITDLSLDHGSQEVGAEWLTIRNGGVYCKSLNTYIISSDMLKQYVIQNISNSIEKEKVAEAFKLRNITEFNNFYTYFYSGAYNWALLFDYNVKLDWGDSFVDTKFIFRTKMGTGYNYGEKVIYRLENGGFKLDYNFIESTGIGMQNLFLDSKINPLVLVFATAIVFNMLWTMVWGLITRIYKIVILFIVMPAMVASNTFDEGARFGKWKDNIIEQVFIAYTVLIMLNLYFALVPTIEDLTTGLITWDELPSTFTGLFSNITLCLNTLGNGLINGLSNVFTSIGGGVSNMLFTIGSISLKSTGLPILLAEMTDATVVVADSLNLYIYLLFFLVLTTLAKEGPKLFGKLLDPGGPDSVLDQGKETKDKVQGLKNDVANSPITKATEKAFDIAKNTAVNLGNLAVRASSGFSELLGNSRNNRNNFTASEVSDLSNNSAQYTNAFDLTNGTFPVRGEVNITAPQPSDGATETIHENTTTNRYANSSGGAGRPIDFGSTVGGSAESEKNKEKEEKKVIVQQTTTVVEEVSSGGSGGGSYFNAGGGGSGEETDIDIITSSHKPTEPDLKIKTDFKLDGTEETTHQIQEEMSKVVAEGDRLRDKVKENKEIISIGKSDQEKLKKEKEETIANSNNEAIKLAVEKLDLNEKELTGRDDAIDIILKQIYEKKRGNDEKVVSNAELTDLESRIKQIKGTRDGNVKSIDTQIKDRRSEVRGLENENNELTGKITKLDEAFDKLDKLETDNKNYVKDTLEQHSKDIHKLQDSEKLTRRVVGRHEETLINHEDEIVGQGTAIIEHEDQLNAQKDKLTAQEQALRRKADAGKTAIAINKVAKQVRDSANAEKTKQEMARVTDQIKKVEKTANDATKTAKKAEKTANKAEKLTKK